MDILVGNVGAKNLLYRNDGVGNFIEVKGTSIGEGLGQTRGVMWADLDGNGLLDAVIVNGVSSGTHYNEIHMNRGGAVFREVKGTSLTSAYAASDGTETVAVALGDFDNDGASDI